jgi:hypothetical protein
MKYLTAILAVVLASLSVPAIAGMDDVTYSLSAITTNQDSAAYTVRGQVEAVYVSIPATKTATVSLATASGVTIFSKSMTSATDGYFPVLFPAYSSAGVALTSLTSGDGSTNAVENAIYTKLGVADVVTATVEPGVGTTGTNAYTAKLIINE